MPLLAFSHWDPRLGDSAAQIQGCPHLGKPALKNPHLFALRFVPIRILNLTKFTIRINPHSSRGKKSGGRKFQAPLRHRSRSSLGIPCRESRMQQERQPLSYNPVIFLQGLLCESNRHHRKEQYWPVLGPAMWPWSSWTAGPRAVVCRCGGPRKGMWVESAAFR